MPASSASAPIGHTEGKIAPKDSSTQVLFFRVPADLAWELEKAWRYDGWKSKNAFAQAILREHLDARKLKPDVPNDARAA